VKTKSGYPVAMTQTYERPRLLVLDILESYAREREIHVVLERVNAQQGWVCTLSSTRPPCDRSARRRARRSWAL